MHNELGQIVKRGSNLTEFIEIQFDDRSSRSLDRWGGSFVISDDVAIDLHDQCDLKMFDGRKGAIVPYRREATEDGRTVIYFTGVEALRD